MDKSLYVLVQCPEGCEPPQYQTSEAAGMDLRAYLESPITLKTMERVLIGTGMRIALPEGMEAQVRPRSGLAYKHGITILNGPGTIDSDYRGEIKALLINLSDKSFVINHGDRIAQLVVASYQKVLWKKRKTLPESKRGSEGHGSTGVK